MNIVQVAIFNTPADVYDYLPGEWLPVIGGRVWVTFRNSKRLGIVVATATIEKPSYRCLPLLACIDEQAVIAPEIMRLAQFTADYYQAPLNEVLSAALPKKLREGKPCAWPVLTHYHLRNFTYVPPGNAHGQQAVIDALKDNALGLSSLQLKNRQLSRLSLTNLVNKQVIEKVDSHVLPTPPKREVECQLDLHPEQAIAVNAITTALGKYQAFLLQGVTGSGKTEVYLQAIAAVLCRGESALVLVPEIGLTPQLVARFEQRFAVTLSVVHSSLNDSERLHAFLSAKEGHASILIGTRSAVFTPMKNLGLIVIDEEHDASFKQMESPRYHARDIALMRAYQQHCPIVLGTATPSLESLYNVAQSKLHLLILSQRASATTNTYYRLLDLRATPMIEGVSAPLLALLKKHLSEGHQVLVFINRRGYSPVLLCHQCGWSADCHACSAKLTLHAKLQRMRCHHCGYQRAIIKRCDACQSPEMVPVGVGTERVSEYLSQALPEANVLRIDRDTVKGKGSFEKSLELIHSGKVNCLVGTQMLAKGHHFPRLSLVAVIDADQGFYSSDFRALERLGQLLLQVAGRAGRDSVKGEVAIQTHVPDNPLLNTLIRKGYDAFAHQLLAERQKAQLPPYNYQGLIRAHSKKIDRLIKQLSQFKQCLQLLSNELVIYGPAPSALEKKGGFFQMQLLIQSDKRSTLQRCMKALRKMAEKKLKVAGVRYHIDIDPT